MRKILILSSGIILLCGIVAGMLAVPPAQNVVVTINGNPETGGVDPPWFVLSKSGKDTVRWQNELNLPCTITFGLQSPFLTEPVEIGPLGTHSALTPEKAPNPPKGWDKTRPNDVYVVYKYSVKCGLATFDPGGGIKP